MYHLTEAYLMSTLVCLLAAFLGAMLCSTIISRRQATAGQAAVPTSAAQSPAQYRFAACCAALFTTVIAVAAPFSAVPVIYTLLVVSVCALMSTLYLVAWRLQPVIRHSASTGNTARTTRLRRTATLLFCSGMLLTLMVIAALVYVLPGHFTYYPTAPDAVPSILV